MSNLGLDQYISALVKHTDSLFTGGNQMPYVSDEEVRAALDVWGESYREQFRELLETVYPHGIEVWPITEDEVDAAMEAWKAPYFEKMRNTIAAAKKVQEQKLSEHPLEYEDVTITSKDVTITPKGIYNLLLEDKEKITRNESTPEARKIWEDVDKAAERAPSKVREHMKEEINGPKKKITEEEYYQLVGLHSLGVEYREKLEECQRLGERILNRPDDEHLASHFSDAIFQDGDTVDDALQRMGVEVI